MKLGSEDSKCFISASLYLYAVSKQFILLGLIHLRDKSLCSNHPPQLVHVQDMITFAEGAGQISVLKFAHIDSGVQHVLYTARADVAKVLACCLIVDELEVAGNALLREANAAL